MESDPSDPSNSQKVLIVIACSAHKNPDTTTTRAGRSIQEFLPQNVGNALNAARHRNQANAVMQGPGVLPAHERYAGHFFQAARVALDVAVASNMHVLIISGGYGVVLATEPIHLYDRTFNYNEWVPVVEQSVVAYANHHGLQKVVAFLGFTGEYAKVVRRITWGANGMQSATLITANIGRNGAMIRVPTFLGEAFTAYVTGTLGPGWRSTAGYNPVYERLP